MCGTHSRVVELRAGGHQARHAHPFGIPFSAHSPPSHIRINRSCLTHSDSIPAHHHITVPYPAPSTIFCVLLGAISCPLNARTPLTPCGALSLHTPIVHTPLGLATPAASDDSPSILTPTRACTHLFFYQGTHSPSLATPLLPCLAHSPRPWGHLLVLGRAGMRSRGPFSSAPPPRPTPPSIPHRLPGSRPARPPLRGGLRRRRRRKEPPFATAERTGRAEPDPGVGAGLGLGERRWGAAPPQEDRGA